VLKRIIIIIIIIIIILFCNIFAFIIYVYYFYNQVNLVYTLLKEIRVGCCDFAWNEVAPYSFQQDDLLDSVYSWVIMLEAIFLLECYCSLKLGLASYDLCYFYLCVTHIVSLELV
jgi:hypothetical protein